MSDKKLCEIGITLRGGLLNEVLLPQELLDKYDVQIHKLDYDIPEYLTEKELEEDGFYEREKEIDRIREQNVDVW